MFICYERVSWRVQHRYLQAQGQETTLGNQPLFPPSGGQGLVFLPQCILRAGWQVSCLKFPPSKRHAGIADGHHHTQIFVKVPGIKLGSAGLCGKCFLPTEPSCWPWLGLCFNFFSYYTFFIWVEGSKGWVCIYYHYWS